MRHRDLIIIIIIIIIIFRVYCTDQTVQQFKMKIFFNTVVVLLLLQLFRDNIKK